MLSPLTISNKREKKVFLFCFAFGAFFAFYFLHVSELSLFTWLSAIWGLPSRLETMVDF